MGTIRSEIHQTRPFASAGEEAVVTLVATADRVRDALGQVVDRHGITLQQFNVLRILRGAGAAGLPTLEIGQRMIDKSPGITRLLDRLEARRLVRRVRCPRDRRQVLCHSTPEANRLLAGLDARMTAAAERCLSALGPAELEELVGLLDRVHASATSTAEPSHLTRTRTRS
jgi:DNA-binding MarR family transcriptional regulator